MTQPSTIQHSIDVAFRHRLTFTTDLAGADEPQLAHAINHAPRRLAVIDEQVAQARPDWVDLLERHASRVLEVPGGEIAKQDQNAPNLFGAECVWRQVMRAIADEGLCRHSSLIVAGGGAVLDAAGFAAATAHRGVRLVRLPTTTLSQCDSGVGVKCAVNAMGQKNFMGAFAVPHAVINDHSILGELPDAAWRSGLAEVVKVALLKSDSLLIWLQSHARELAARDEALGATAWRQSAELHLNHIAEGGDPFEHGSMRPLDFGHWSAHQIEILTDFRVSHGDAVAIGLAIDLAYGRRTGLTNPSDAGRAIRLLEQLGFDLSLPESVSVDDVLEGVESFRQHIGGRLTLAMIQSPGIPIEVHEIDPVALRAAIDEVSQPAATLHS